MGVVGSYLYKFLAACGNSTKSPSPPFEAARPCGFQSILRKPCASGLPCGFAVLTPARIVAVVVLSSLAALMLAAREHLGRFCAVLNSRRKFAPERAGGERIENTNRTYRTNRTYCLQTPASQIPTASATGVSGGVSAVANILSRVDYRKHRYACPVCNNRTHPPPTHGGCEAVAAERAGGERGFPRAGVAARGQKAECTRALRPRVKPSPYLIRRRLNAGRAN